MRTLPALLVGIIALLLLSTFAIQPAHAAGSAPFMVLLPLVVQPGAAGMTPEAQAVLNAVNQARALQTAHNGRPCPPLSISAALVRAAHNHSQDMAQRHYFNHRDPDGNDPLARAQLAGYSGSQIGENIAAGYPTAAAAIDGWLHSTGHRANILNCAYSQTGIGYYALNDDPAGYRYYWTEVFGAP